MQLPSRMGYRDSDSIQLHHWPLRQTTTPSLPPHMDGIQRGSNNAIGAWTPMSFLPQIADPG